MWYINLNRICIDLNADNLWRIKQGNAFDLLFMRNTILDTSLPLWETVKSAAKFFLQNNIVLIY